MSKATGSIFPEISIDHSGVATRIVRSILGYVVLLLLGIVVWSVMAPIKGAVIASGKVKIETNSKTIQHLEGGIIKEIYVNEGSIVNQNQPLIRLEDTSSNSELKILSDKLLAAKAKEARLEAQRMDKPEISFPPELLQGQNQLLNNERSLFQSMRKTLGDKIKLFNIEIKQIESQINNLNKEIDAINKSMGFVEQQLAANKQLSAKGYVGDNQIWESEKILSEKRERLNAQHAAIAQAQINITNIRTQINSLENQYRQEADDQLKDTRKELATLEEEMRPTQNKNDRTIITAPLSGQVINMKVNTIGGVIAPGQKLLEIVPITNKLIIEAKIRTDDIDSVSLEQTANIQLLAYNRRKTPLLAGKIKYISGDVLEEHTRPGEFYYLAHIEVDADALAQLAKNVKLFPGMPITAFIQTKQKTFSEFVLEPILDNLRHTFREE